MTNGLHISTVHLLIPITCSVSFSTKAVANVTAGGCVTPIDSIVTAATAHLDPVY